MKEQKLNLKFQYGNKTVEYVLIQSKRRKTCEVIIYRDEIIIRAPFDKPITEVEKILNDKIRWISQKQKEFQRKKPEIIKPSYDKYSTLPYLGNNYPLELKYHKNPQTERFEFLNDRFVVYLNNEEMNQKEKIRTIYNDWLISKANTIFDQKVNQYSKIIDINPKRILIKNLKNRWGSVIKNKTICLNVNLIKTPENIIDYIIIHEICHFKIKGHSYVFWDYLKQFVPNYKQKIEWLGRNSENILF